MSFSRHIPNMLTLFNLLLGCLAIVYIFVDHTMVNLSDESYYFDGKLHVDSLHFGKLHIAALLVILATIVDFLDGFTAKIFKAHSDIGKQLDSLADMVTFGVVPGLIAYQLLSVAMFDTKIAFDLRLLTFIPAFALTLMAALRLAIFNTDPGQKKVFRGLAVPAVALFIAALPLAVFLNEGLVAMLATNAVFLYLSILLLSILMIAKIPMISLKFSGDDPSGNKLRIIFLLCCVIIVAVGFFGFKILFANLAFIIVFYIFYSFGINVLK